MTDTAAPQKTIYNDDIVKLFTLATVFWGIAGFLVGVLIAAQLAFPTSSASSATWSTWNR